MVPNVVPNGASAGGLARWVTVFNGSRDGYQVPLALAEVGRLEALVTDWYSPLDRPAVARALAAAPARVRAGLARRYAAGLASRQVRSMPWQALRQRVRPATLSDVDRQLGRRAGTLARARGAGLLAYSFYAHSAFTAYGSDEGARVLFQVQAHPAAVRDVLLAERDGTADAFARAAFDLEPDLIGASARYAALAGEPALADRCLVPSRYVRATLVAAGVAPERIAVVPYGVDLGAFRPGARAAAPSTFRVLYVGQLLRRKGVHYLLEAWRRLALRGAELLLVARGPSDPTVLRGYDGWYRIERDVHDRAQMARIYRESDLCCLPSLTDSFGHVLLEALACGTPIIGTPNTAAPDLVTEGETGFVVPTRDANALADALAWAYEHRTTLGAMRHAARRRAEMFSWDAFRRGVVAALP